METTERFNQTKTSFHKILSFPKKPSFECDGCRLFAEVIAHGLEVDGDGKRLFVPLNISECPISGRHVREGS